MNIIVAGSQQPELNRALAGWLQAKMGFEAPFREPYSTMGIFSHGELVAALIFENYQPERGTVEVGGASASPKWLTRTVMKAMGDFMFGDLGCQTAIFRTSEKNERANAVLKRCGFPMVAVPGLRGRDEAEHVFYLTDTAWDQNPLHSKEVSHG
jgi:RimJ/RimL family protein N-acetyltransferase